VILSTPSYEEPDKRVTYMVEWPAECRLTLAAFIDSESIVQDITEVTFCDRCLFREPCGSPNARLRHRRVG